MKFRYIVIADPEHYPEDYAPCSVCGQHPNDGTYYMPEDMTEEQENQIRKMWGGDPYGDFSVCQECLEGHVWGEEMEEMWGENYPYDDPRLWQLTPDLWLQEQWEQWQAIKGLWEGAQDFEEAER